MWSKDNKIFEDGSSIEGWDAVQFDVTGNYYYDGCRNDECSETDRAVLNQKGGWGWSPVPLSFTFGTLSIPNPASFTDQIEGLKTGSLNFFKQIGNLPVETPILMGTASSLHDFGVNKFFDYGTYRNTPQRLGGFQAQGILTISSLLFWGAEGAAETAGNGLTNAEIIQKAATIAERRIGGTGAVAGTQNTPTRPS